jgi:hypothetical protein
VPARLSFWSRLDALLVVGGAALGRELRLLRAVEIGERPRDHVAVQKLRRIRHRLEEPPAHDLEALLGACCHRC